MQVERIELGNAIKDNMMIMSIEAVTNRALPFLEDGFKPSQRKMLYTMKTMGLFNKNAKTANIEGQNMKLNPHSGSSSVAVRMTREREVLLTPFIDGKGSFGKVYSSTMEAAAPRYTSMQLAPICHELLDNLHKHKMVDNYDGTTKEPVFLSASFPNILANPQDGIGIGFACSFPSYNLVELCDACISVLKNKDKFKDIIKVLPGPDFTTGAQYLVEPEELKKIYETGQGRFLLRAKFFDNKKENTLEVTEIPYTTTAEKVIADIQKMYDKNKFNEIVDVVDEIGINGFKVSIQYKPRTDVDKLIDKLYAMTSLQSVFSNNMTLVYNKRPYTLGVIDVIKKWIEHRRVWIQEESNYDIKEKSDKLHLLRGLEKILLDIDKAISIVKKSKNDDEVIIGLQSFFKIDEIQANYVAEIKLRNFNQDYILNRTAEIKKLEKEITDLENLDITKKMIDDLTSIKKTYGLDRKTEVVTDWSEVKLDEVLPKVKKEKVEPTGTSVLFTGINSVRRQFSSSSDSIPGHIRYDVDNAGELLVFTSAGRTFKVKIDNIKTGSTIQAETLLPKKALALGETIILTTPFIIDSNIFVVYANNKAIKIPQHLYDLNRICIKLGFSTASQVVHIEAISEDKIINVAGKAIDTSTFKPVSSRIGIGNNI